MVEGAPTRRGWPRGVKAMAAIIALAFGCLTVVPRGTADTLKSQSGIRGGGSVEAEGEVLSLTTRQCNQVAPLSDLKSRRLQAMSNMTNQNIGSAQWVGGGEQGGSAVGGGAANGEPGPGMQPAGFNDQGAMNPAAPGQLPPGMPPQQMGGRPGMLMGGQGGMPMVAPPGGPMGPLPLKDGREANESTRAIIKEVKEALSLERRKALRKRRIRTGVALGIITIIFIAVHILLWRVASKAEAPDPLGIVKTVRGIQGKGNEKGKKERIVAKASA